MEWWARRARGYPVWLLDNFQVLGRPQDVGVRVVTLEIVSDVFMLFSAAVFRYLFSFFFRVFSDVTRTNIFLTFSEVTRTNIILAS